MKNLKRYWWVAAIAAAAVLLAFILIPRQGNQAVSYDNILRNGDFSAKDDQGNPTGWYKDAYAGLAGCDFEVTETEYGAAAHIVNHMPKDARYAQQVSVSPNTLYRLHGWIKASAEGGRGANLSVEGVYAFSESVFETQDAWQEVTLYGRTGENQHSLIVFARLGGYSGEAEGEAYFRDITLCRADAVPEGSSAVNWYAQNASAGNDGEASAQGTAAPLLLTSSAVYLLLFMALCSLARKNHAKSLTGAMVSNPWSAVAVLFIALALRIFIAVKIPGYDVDIGCFRSWANAMAQRGPGSFYPAEHPFSFCDYPPGYMWLLWIMGLIGKALGTDTTELLVKLPPIFLDMALCAVLYRIAKKEHPADHVPFALTVLYAFNPLVLAAGAAWGQADAVMTLLLFLVVYFAIKGKWKAALPLYMAAVLCKPQALMFGPLGLLALVMELVNSRKQPDKRKDLLKDVLWGFMLTVLTAAVIAGPFSIHQQPDWLITLYGETMGRYAYATVNACNAYLLLGKNWVSTATSIPSFWPVPCFIYLLAALPLAVSAFRHRKQLKNAGGKERLRLYLLGGLAAALLVSLLLMIMTGTLTYSILGTVMIVYCIAVISVLYILSGDIGNLPVFGAALLLMLFNTGVMMHERYLFPAVALLLLGYLIKKDTRILWLAVGVTVAGFLNVGCGLDRNIRIGGAAGHLDAPAVGLVSDMPILVYLSSAMNCALCCASFSLCLSLSWGECVVFSGEKREAPEFSRETLQKMTQRDWALMLLVTMLYAVLAFSNLGSTKAPQTSWVSKAPEDQFTVDLGSEKRFHMLYYGGIHQYASDFSVEISKDGTLWDQYYTAGMQSGDCFKWKYLSSTSGGTLPVDLNGRYVRITADHYLLTLFEILFRDANTDAVLPVYTVISADPEVSALFDEQNTLEGDPGWYNSTYFDEIYHARTAYEHLHHMQPYEFTHPPLGKVMMSWAIAVFGMTPFGWRFAGALAGVMMLPGMYLLGRLLTKRSWGGIGASLLLALDLMHFTQTRIATIDSFVVLWIIWMVYFMLRWLYQDFFHQPFWKTLIPLALSGLCMGLGVASKWTACYAGVVLALIFFYGIWRRGCMVVRARRIPEGKQTEKTRAVARGGKALVATVASCLVFFILVPLAVYYCAYIPFFSYDGVGVSLERIVSEAQRMLAYHNQPGLGMDHSFYSPWYQWPVIYKPMWYASNQFEPEGYQSSILAMGNPAVWWTGLLAILAVCALWVKSHMLRDKTLSLHTTRDDPRCALILVCYFVQLLPWVLVPRGTYIYHYFPCVPFLILAIILCLDMIAEKEPKAIEQTDKGAAEAPARRTISGKKIALGLLIFLLVCAAVLFIGFFPYASGVTVSQKWMDAMKWFDGWLWY